MALTVDQCLELLSDLTKYSFADFLEVDVGTGLAELDFEKALEAGALRSVKKFTVDRAGKVTVELYSQLDIITTILRVHGKISASSVGTEGLADSASSEREFRSEDLHHFLQNYEASLGSDNSDDFDA